MLNIKFFLLVFLLLLIIIINIYLLPKKNGENAAKIEKVPRKKKVNNINHIFYTKNNNNKIALERCYLISDYSNIKIIHIIITRFVLEFTRDKIFNPKIHSKDYITHQIFLMKKYLLNSLEHQSCKDFIWVLDLGDKANITNIQD